MAWSAHKIIAACFPVLLVMTLTRPAAYPMMQKLPDSIFITEKDNGGTVQVALGDTITLRLEAIPGTGYAWKVVRNEPGLLKLMGESFFEPIGRDAKKEPRVGAPENQVFRFTAQNRGTNTLELHYVRGWEEKKEPLKTMRVTVIIQ
jgi:predicted secreted protein